MRLRRAVLALLASLAAPVAAGPADTPPEAAPPTLPDFSQLLRDLQATPQRQLPPLSRAEVYPVVPMAPPLMALPPAEPLGETVHSLADFTVETMPAPSPPRTALAGRENRWVVNINTAPAEVLAAIPSLGPWRAEAIVAHREANGPFERITQVTEVFGVTEEIFDALFPHLTCEGATTFHPGAVISQASPREGAQP
jgi:competence ComEA-like helix-hairpin-helix protein